MYKALMEAHPKDALRLLCRVEVGDHTVVTDGPTEQVRQRSLQRDKVFMVSRPDGTVDVHHIEVQVKRTGDFPARMAAYWAGLAIKYEDPRHQIHQTAVWPVGGGPPGSLRRNRMHLEWDSVNVPDDLDPEALLASPLAPLVLWSSRRPADFADRIGGRIGELPNPEQQLVLVDLCMLAEEGLAAQVVTALRSRGMGNVLEGTEAGREIAQKNLDRGLEQGLVRSMRLTLQTRFGDIPGLDDLARKLVAEDHDANLVKVVSGVPLTELQQL
ncbi:hypothetical protein [Actinoplanes awajinensis]|uniref:Rpn family recombination-promoting nuclease/putative transposase n=1 Tax=Actinoplanes awajinensis subsp. mycoplanecinus TaxID=135947 RepID=A0A117MPU9_9ACTN|nr:hypothetical protein [Actinoplanes awajinensis]KUL29202.1 hypothetical protein ADL15_29005 [Actinoplanes awajinensis subsp. mycoplanecinus]